MVCRRHHLTTHSLLVLMEAALHHICQYKNTDTLLATWRHAEVGAGVEDGICICEDAQQEDATFFVLPEDVKASFRQEIHERSYKVTSVAACAISCQYGQHDCAMLTMDAALP